MRRKLDRREVARIRKVNPGVEIWRCKPDGDVMRFWCPRCLKEHTHGKNGEQYEMTPRSAHCTDFKTPGYFVFWC